MGNIRMVALAALIYTSSLATPLSAQPVDVVSLSVSYADLAMDRVEGRKTFDQRIAVAVRRVCGDFAAKDLAINRTVRACSSQSLAAANRQRDVAIANYGDRQSREADMALRNR